MKDGTFCVDYLSSKPLNYTIEVIPASEIVREYCDGGSLRQFSFVFASREYYSNIELENLENNDFYEKFSNWLEDCTKNGILPELGENMISQSIKSESLGYMYEGNGNTARYQIQCKLIYYKKS